MTDNVGNVSALGATQTITVDNTAPTVTAVALANGGVAKTADAGDTATITYSEKIKASTFCSTWVDDGTTQTLSGVTLNFINNGTTDALTIASAGCTFHLQQVVAGNHIGATMTVPNSTLAWDPTAKTLTITLGVPSGSVNTNVSPAKPSYTPDGALTDWAATRSRRRPSPRARTATSRATSRLARRRANASETLPQQTEHAAHDLSLQGSCPAGSAGSR